eukprot:COSAG06_NODE_7906_length_2336_cov_3.474743_2_plen_107_part_00
MASLESMTVPQLKEMAEKRGIKQPGVGWPKGCPPKGNKPDIIRALKGGGGRAGDSEAFDQQLARGHACALTIEDGQPRVHARVHAEPRRCSRLELPRWTEMQRRLA